MMSKEEKTSTKLGFRMALIWLCNTHFEIKVKESYCQYDEQGGEDEQDVGLPHLPNMAL